MVWEFCLGDCEGCLEGLGGLDVPLLGDASTRLKAWVLAGTGLCGHYALLVRAFWEVWTVCCLCLCGRFASTHGNTHRPHGNTH